MKQNGLSAYDANVLTAEKSTAMYFDEVLRDCDDAKLAANWITAELFGKLNKAALGIEDSPIKAEHIASLVKLIKSDVISGKIAKQVFDIMFETSKDPGQIVKEKGLEQVTDEGAIEQHVDEVLNSNPEKVEQYKAGKDKLFGFFVGQVMKASQGKANPSIVNKLIMAKLDK